MNLANLIPNRWRKSHRTLKKPTGRMLVVHWDRENVHYLVSSTKGKRLHARGYGTLPHSPFPSPLAALAEHLKNLNLNVQHLAILLSRPELEQATLALPPSSDEELPVIVASAMEQQLGESESAPTVDYLRLATERNVADAMVDVQAFALTPKMMETIRRDAEQSGFNLTLIGSRQLATMALLQNVANIKSGLNIVVQLYPGEIELSLCEADQPRILRSIRVNQEEKARWPELIRREVGRCVTLLPPEVEELTQQWIIICSSDDARAIALSLAEGGDGAVVQLDPLANWSVEAGTLQAIPAETDAAPTLSDSHAMSAQTVLPSGALVGAAWELWNEQVRVNLLAPKRPPEPPNPFLKPALWSAAGLAALTLAGYALMTDVWKLQEEVQALQVEVQDSSKLAAKMQEKSDNTTLVEKWLADQVDWLAVLNEVSQRMPDGQDASVGRLSASAEGKQAVLDLSVQVVDPEKISQLEGKLRSVKYAVSSKRISQSPEASEYPWRFETRIVFDIEADDWRNFISRAELSKKNSAAAADSRSNNEAAPQSESESTEQPTKSSTNDADTVEVRS
jgi:hypothetical protein